MKVFTQRKLAYFLREKPKFLGGKRKITLRTFLGNLGATYTVHLKLIGKLVVDFLLVIIELFLLGAFILSQCTCLTDGQTDRQMLTGTPHLHSCSTVTRSDVVYWVYRSSSLYTAILPAKSCAHPLEFLHRQTHN